jgi:hypothetical protein
LTPVGGTRRYQAAIGTSVSFAKPLESARLPVQATVFKECDSGRVAV